MTAEEPPLDPDQPIIDPHLHLWEIRPAPGAPQAPQRFLLHEAQAMIAASGHNITHTVFLECHAMYRQEGPPELRSLGETEFANGMAAMSAGGGYGPTRIAHRIVGNADLTLGEAVGTVLEAYVRAAGERFRGVRGMTVYSEAAMFGHPCDPSLKGLMRTPRFQAGAKVLARMGLSLDVWCVHTQLGDLIALARAVPGLSIILDHVGTPETLGAYAGRAGEARAEWAAGISELARCPNVRIKLGGLGMDISQAILAETGPGTSATLAEAWRPLIETCIEAFSPQRCMFESNFPPDKAAASYGATWNAFKIIAAGCSAEERDRLFQRTAAETYRIALD